MGVGEGHFNPMGSFLRLLRKSFGCLRKKTLFAAEVKYVSVSAQVLEVIADQLPFVNYLRILVFCSISQP